MTTVIERIISTSIVATRRATAASRDAMASVMALLRPLFDGEATARERLAVFGLAPSLQLQPVRIRRRRNCDR